MNQINNNFVNQTRSFATQFQRTPNKKHNNLHGFLKWLRQTYAKDIYRWADAINNYAAGHYTVETFVKGRNIVVYVGNDEDNTFCRGSAHCDKNDRFGSNVGRAIALYSALCALEDGCETNIQNNSDLEPPLGT